MRSYFSVTAIAAIAFFMASSAQALSTSFGGAACGSCDGSEFTLEIVDNLNSTFSVKITLDSTGYDESREGLAQIGFGGIQGWSDAALVSSPATSLVAWSDPVNSPIGSSSLCGGPGTTDKVCTTGFTDITNDDVYVWEFLVTDGTLKTDTSEWHLGGQYANASDLTDGNSRTPNGKVISENGGASPVPEPSAALVFAAGLLTVSGSLRRKAA